MMQTNEKTLFPQVKYNPFIHGTNSSIFAVLAKSNNQIMSPIEMMTRYQAAPMTGELTKGGYNTADSVGNTSFALLIPDQRFNNAYTLDKVIKYTKFPIMSYECCLQEFKEALALAPKIVFSNINLLLIYYTQARQMGYALEEIISPQELDLFEENVELSYQFFYLVSLLGTYIHPNFKAVSTLQVKDFEEIEKYLNYENIVKNIKENKINMEEIVANPSRENLEKALLALKLPESSGLSGKDFFCLEAVYPATQQKYYDLDEEKESSDYASFCLSINQSSAKIEKLLEDFLRKRRGQSFFQLLGSKITEPMAKVKEKIVLFRQLLNTSADKFLFTAEQKKFLTNQFPIILICESQQKINLTNVSTQEYRSNQPLTLGEDIPIIATDNDVHRKAIVEYLRANQINNVQVILFEDLEHSKKTGHYPVTIESIDEAILQKEKIVNSELPIIPKKFSKNIQSNTHSFFGASIDNVLISTKNPMLVKTESCSNPYEQLKIDILTLVDIDEMNLQDSVMQNINSSSIPHIIKELLKAMDKTVGNTQEHIKSLQLIKAVLEKPSIAAIDDCLCWSNALSGAHRVEKILGGLLLSLSGALIMTFAILLTGVTTAASLGLSTPLSLTLGMTLTAFGVGMLEIGISLVCSGHNDYQKNQAQDPIGMEFKNLVQALETAYKKPMISSQVL